MLRILIGENDAQAEFNRAADRGASVSWIVPKAAEPGDDALFLFRGSLFTALGVVQTSPISAMYGQRKAAKAEVGALRLLDQPIRLEEVAKRIPEWKWPRDPRSYVTPSPDVATKLLALLALNEPSAGTRPPADQVARATILDAPVRWNELLPERYRQTAARVLSRSIQAAHALKDTCWTVTLDSRFVRLNVGMPLALTLSRSGCNLIVMDDPSSLRALARAGLRVRREQEFPSAPGTVIMAFPLASLTEVHARAWESHLQAMKIAAARQPSTPHRGYSHALVLHLRALGFEVPDSNCREAATLREGLSQAGATRNPQQEPTTVEPFAPENIEDARRYIQASIVRRQGQGKFREAVLSAYGNACAITGCRVSDVLDAAHIVPYCGESTNHVQNGILLRADLHVLFDCGLLDFDAGWRVRLNETLLRSAYADLEGKSLRMPKERSYRPSLEALTLRREPVWPASTR